METVSEFKMKYSLIINRKNLRNRNRLKLEIEKNITEHW